MPKEKYSKYYNPLKRRRQYEQNMEKELAYGHQKFTETRKKLFVILGNKCSNPKCRVPGGMDNRFCLQVDHINGGGNKERLAFGGSIQMWKYYVDHPEEAKAKLQLLCANCNWIKRGENNEARQIRRVTPRPKKLPPHEPVKLTAFISTPSQSV